MAKSRIIKELSNNEITMEVALNRLLIIASDLENEDLANWASAELNGYNKHMELPAYRQKKSTHFTYSGINGNFQVTNITFPYIEILLEQDEHLLEVHITDSISSIQSMVTNSEKPACYIDYTWMSGHVYEKTGIICTSIKQNIPVNFMQNIMSEIKTRLLQVLIKLDKEYGCLDDLDIDTTAKSPEEVAEINRIVNNFIFVDNSVRIGDKNKIEESNFK